MYIDRKDKKPHVYKKRSFFEIIVKGECVLALCLLQILEDFSGRVLLSKRLLCIPILL